MTSTFKTDHGKYLCAEDGGGDEGLEVNGRPSGLVTGTRDSAGAWETFEVTRHPDGTVSLLSCGDETADPPHAPKYGCAENEGKEGYFVCNRPNPGAWEKLRPVEMGDHKVAFEVVCRPGYYLCAEPDGRLVVRQPMWDNEPSENPGGWETFVSSANLFEHPPVVIPPPGGGGGEVKPPEPGTYPPVQGPMSFAGRAWTLQGQQYLPHATHFMEAFSLFCRKEQDARQQIAVLADRSYAQGVRPCIRFLDTLGWYGYWRGREVSPIDFIARDGYHVPATPQYYEKLVAFLTCVKEYGTLVRWSRGDLQMFGQGEQQVEAVKRHVRGGAAVLNHVGHEIAEQWTSVNEGVLNGCETPAEARLYREEWKARMPHVQAGLGAPSGTEESDDLIAWAEGADFGVVHGYRPADGSIDEATKTLRHTFSVRREGYGSNSVTQRICQEEPFGTGADVSGGRTNSPELLSLGSVMSHVTAQAWTYMSSQGVRWNGPIQAQAGFEEVLRATRTLQAFAPTLYDWHVYRGGNAENPLAAYPGYWGDSGVTEGPARCDGASGNGTFVNVVYGGRPRFRVRCQHGFEGVVWNPGTDESYALTMSPGQVHELSYEYGRVVMGVLK